MLPGARTPEGAIYVLQGPPPAGTPLVGGIAVTTDGVIYASNASSVPGFPANTVAPSISGTPVVGQTLTCTPGTWTGTPTPTITRQWRANGVNIPGATGTTYVVELAYANQTIRCLEIATNSVGTASAQSNALTVAGAPVNTVAPTVTGNTTVGSVLTTDNGIWTSTPTATYTYAWFADGLVISGQTANTYTTLSGDAGKTITSRVTATNPAGTAQANSQNSILVGGIPPGNTVAPVISGGPNVSTLLTTTNGTWTGTPTPTLTYQWRANGAGIPGATSQTYTTVAGDVGKAITCVVTGTNLAGSADATSNAITVIQPPVNLTAPVVTGEGTPGQTLTSGTGAWNANPTASYAYQWKANGTNISGQTASSYVVQAGDVGTTITCAVTATNTGGSATATSNGILITAAVGQPPVNTVAPVITGTGALGNTLSLTSQGTWTGAAPISYSYSWQRDGVSTGSTGSSYVVGVADQGTTITCRVTGSNVDGTSSASSNGIAIAAAQPPVNTVAPVISGNTTSGSVLSCTTGTWTGDATITYTYQWRKNTTPISGQTASTYTSVVGDVGATITCTVTGTNSAGNSSATSNGIVVTAVAQPPVNTVAPVISGNTVSGSVLSCTTGTWTGDATITYTYQWRKNSTPISGQTSSTYTSVTGDVGATITCTVTGTNGAGNSSATSNGIVVTAAAGFTPASLFASGEQGAWYDPSDLTTMFQDSAGTTPVTADGQPVGRILDKSGRGNHATQATAAARPLYKTSGGLHWLQFDGVGNGLATASVNFTSTNKMSLFIGNRRNTASPMGALVELNNLNVGNSFGVYFPYDGSNTVVYGMHDLASAGYDLQQTTDSPAPVIAVWSSLMDRAASAGTRTSIRKNSASVGSNTRSDAISGNFMNAPIYIGARTNSSLYLNGRIYPLIILGRTATTQEITDTEQWVAAKTGVTLP